MEPITSLRATYENDSPSTGPMYVSSLDSAKRNEKFFGKLLTVGTYYWYNNGWHLRRPNHD